MRTINWLARHLNARWQRGQGAMLVVTHDRWFLDEVCTSMWEVHDGQVDPFEGGYSATSCSAWSATAWPPLPRNAVATWRARSSRG